MRSSATHSAIAAVAILLATLHAQSLSAQTFTFKSIAPSLLEERLRRAGGANRERQATLQSLFAEAGCPQLTEQTGKGLSGPNVLCTLPGTEAATLVVGAHYDKVSAGQGVIDNWSGASMLPSLLQSLNGQPHRLTFVFVGFSDEELGLRGSIAFLKALTPEDRANLKAMVNIDCVGLGPAEVWVSHADKDLVKAISAVARALKLPVAGMDMDNVGLSDSQPFRDKKIPTIDVHSITRETLPLLHSNRDTQEAVRMNDYAETYQLLAGYLAFLDITWGKPASPVEK